MNGQSRVNNPEHVTTTTESNASKISTTTGTGIKELTISVESFNFHGYKQSFDYILSRFVHTYFMCLCETWVRPSELSLIQNNIDSHEISNVNSYVVFYKSRMSEDDEHSTGRLYGGVAIICKVNDGLSYEIINSRNSRILTVLIKDRYDRPIHIILCAYMHYFDGSEDQNEEFLTCIDAMQVIINEYNEAVPIKFLGDFNAQLPRSKVTSNNWYKSKGFNAHIRLLCDFLVGNELSIVDFMFYQKTSYTYFNISRNIPTWIDHVFSTNYDVCYINSCDIVSLDDSNVSGHLPIRILITLNVQHYNNSIPTETGRSDSLFANWNKKLNNFEYSLDHGFI